MALYGFYFAFSLIYIFLLNYLFVLLLLFISPISHWREWNDEMMIVVTCLWPCFFLLYIGQHLFPKIEFNLLQTQFFIFRFPTLISIFVLISLQLLIIYWMGIIMDLTIIPTDHINGQLLTARINWPNQFSSKSVCVGEEFVHRYLAVLFHRFYQNIFLLLILITPSISSFLG